jgi:hypothetical protein
MTVIFIKVLRGHFGRGYVLTVSQKQNDGMNFIKFILYQVEDTYGDCSTS